MDRPTVALRHELADGSAHVDWMLARDDAGADPLITFRLDEPPWDCPPGGVVTATRIADHRPVYLTYEGAISGGRGTVHRLGRGAIEAWSDDVGARGGWAVTVAWEGRAAPQMLECVPVGGDAWSIRALPMP